MDATLRELSDLIKEVRSASPHFNRASCPLLKSRLLVLPLPSPGQACREVADDAAVLCVCVSRQAWEERHATGVGDGSLTSNIIRLDLCPLPSQVGLVHSTRPGEDDGKALKSLGFQTGDFVDVAIL